MILRETLKQKIDVLNENQLTKIARFIDFIKLRAQNWMKTTTSVQQATPAKERRVFVNG